MKIAINTRFLLADQMEGVGWYTYELCKRWAIQHPEDEFYFLFDRDYDSSFVFAENVTPIVIQPPARHPILFLIWFEFGVYRALRKIKPDIFFSPDGFLSLRSSVPTIITIHDIAHKHFPSLNRRSMNRYYRYFIPRFLKKAKKVITVSNFTRKDVIQSYHLQPSKISVIHNGSREIFTPLNQEEQLATKSTHTDGKDYFFFVGSIHPRKNLPRVIQAFESYKQQTNSADKLVISGRFVWKSNATKKIIDDSPVKNDILLTGHVSERQLHGLIASCKGLLYPSLYEGFGFPIIEALSARVPVVTSEVSSMPEVGGTYAIYVDPTSIESITNGLKAINREMREDLINSEELEAHLNLFNWDKAAKQTYHELSLVVNEESNQ